MTTARTRPTIDTGEVVAALRMILSPGQVTELRALSAVTPADRRALTYSGYFDDAQKLAEAAATIKSAKGVYFVLNPCNPALLSRAVNRIKPAHSSSSTSDNDIVNRRWLPIDLDPVRPADISSTDAEHQAAIELGYEIRAALASEGWPEPIIADSGNGCHLLYRVNLPADDGKFIERCLKAIAFRFDMSTVMVDTGVGNASRIFKLYGSRSCKGDDTPERPHRMARILESGDVRVVPVELLEALAASAPQAEQPRQNGQHRGGEFSIDAWIGAHCPEAQGPTSWQGGRKWIIPTCPWNADHTNRAAFIVEHRSGAISAGCHHNGCQGNDWHALRDLKQPGWRDRRAERNGHGLGGSDFFGGHNSESEGDPLRDEVRNVVAMITADAKQPIGEFMRRLDEHRDFLDDLARGTGEYQPVEPIGIGQLIDAHPTLRPPVIEGLLRRGEVANIVAKSKVGKSWAAYGPLLCLTTGRHWLDIFKCQQGRALLIDNELHPETLANRIKAVAKEMGIDRGEYSEHLDVLCLRGRSLTVNEFPSLLRRATGYDLIILDALYRSLPPGTSENDNAAMAAVYNTIDFCAQQANAAFLIVHHATKGNQAEKDVTDVGAGAGSLSRAVDSHLILRPHNDPEAVVLDAALRSFKPIEPLCLRFTFPVWSLAPDLDPANLRRQPSGQDQRQAQRDAEGRDAILTALVDGPATIRDLRERTGGMGKARVERLVYGLLSEGKLSDQRTCRRGNETVEYALIQGDVV